MSRVELKKSLNELRAEVDRLGDRDPKLTQHLTELISDLEEQTGHDDIAKARAGMAAPLSRAITQFEVGHPDIAAILNRVMSALASMGI